MSESDAIVIVHDLARAMHDLKREGATEFSVRADDWVLACYLGHEIWIVDNTGLGRAREVLGDPRAAVLYSNERIRLDYISRMPGARWPGIL